MYMYNSCKQAPFTSLISNDYQSLLNTVQWLFDFKQFDWFGGHQLHISSYSSDWLYMENARKLYLFSNKYLPVKNNLLLYLIKLYSI